MHYLIKIGLTIAIVGIIIMVLAPTGDASTIIIGFTMMTIGFFIALCKVTHDFANGGLDWVEKKLM